MYEPEPFFIKEPFDIFPVGFAMSKQPWSLPTCLVCRPNQCNTYPMYCAMKISFWQLLHTFLIIFVPFDLEITENI